MALGGFGEDKNIITMRDAAQKVLEYLDRKAEQFPRGDAHDVAAGLRAALAQEPRAEPVAWRCDGGCLLPDEPLKPHCPRCGYAKRWHPLYAAPSDTVPREIAEKMAAVLCSIAQTDTSLGVMAHTALQLYKETKR
jgi:hypothetical protein